MSRYEKMKYRYCGSSGLQLPVVSLGFWHNFGTEADHAICTEMVTGAFELGITSFDLANNYGPVPGSAEERFGKILKEQMSAHRDEIIISTKAGYDMWDGPYGCGGSKKYLVSSLDQSLKRMGLEYVDIFYHHVPDPNTPMEETADALKLIVQQGKALYVGISNYNAQQTQKMEKLLNERGVHCLINQISFSMTERRNQPAIERANELGIGTIAFCPLAQGVLTGKYMNGIPKDSRAAGESVFLKSEQITEKVVEVTKKLSEIADNRGQSLAQMALAWALRHTTSVIIGARKFSQIEENCGCVDGLEFSKEELEMIEEILI